MSITYVSSISIVGAPADVYVYGTGYLWRLLGCALAGVTLTTFTVPFVYQFQEASIYTYLELRYNKNMFVLAIGMVFGLFCCCAQMMILSYLTAITMAAITKFRIGLIKSV